MRNLLLFLALSFIVYSCLEISGKETRGENRHSPEADATKYIPREELRVGREEAMEMRARRGKDDASVKISARDLQALMTSAPAINDSFIFYFATYNIKSEKEKKRYQDKTNNANWENVGRKPSTLLVGFVSGNPRNTMHLNSKHSVPVISVYDLGVVCPPPPNCGCEIAQ